MIKITYRQQITVATCAMIALCFGLALFSSHTAKQYLLWAICLSATLCMLANILLPYLMRAANLSRSKELLWAIAANLIIVLLALPSITAFFAADN